MTLDQGLRLCDVLEGLVRRGNRPPVDNELALSRIQAAFGAAEVDPYVADRAARAVAEIGQYLEAPLSHIRLLRLRERALTAVSRLRAAILLSQDSPAPVASIPAAHSPAPTAASVL